jgi:hypothetical protein
MTGCPDLSAMVTTDRNASVLQQLQIVELLLTGMQSPNKLPTSNPPRLCLHA